MSTEHNGRVHRIIRTSNPRPPIPVRMFDWRAWFEDDGEEARRYGYGATEADAILDLINEYGDAK